MYLEFRLFAQINEGNDEYLLTDQGLAIAPPINRAKSKLKMAFGSHVRPAKHETAHGLPDDLTSSHQ